MTVTFKIRRLDPRKSDQPWDQEYDVDAAPGQVVLYALHEIHDRQDPTLAYRYSCRGAICGSCAIRINGVAALACKTQMSGVAKEGDTVAIEPLMNLHVIRDLVVDQKPFFEYMRCNHAYLINEHERALDEAVDPVGDMSKQEYDQWNRSIDCIKCQACLSDCPKRAEDEGFEGPAACVEVYKHAMDARERNRQERILGAAEAGGIWDCDQHANCIKVCPKDCRPMRAINFLRRRVEKPAEAT